MRETQGDSAASRCKPGDWVEIERVLLEPPDRAANLPPETAGKPLVMWVHGFAQAEAGPGDDVTVETMTGRLVTGSLSDATPGYYHTFGNHIAELAHVGADLRARVAAYRASEGTGGDAASATAPGVPESAGE